MNYTQDFERLWAIYPKRRPSNPKIKAFKAFAARLKQGYSYDDIKSGLDRYIACKEAENQIGTPFILQGATFLGPDEWFLEDLEAQIKEVRESCDKKRIRLNHFLKAGYGLNVNGQKLVKILAWEIHN